MTNIKFGPISISGVKPKRYNGLYDAQPAAETRPPPQFAQRRWHWMSRKSSGRQPYEWNAKQERWLTGFGSWTPADAAKNGWRWWAPIEDAPKRAWKAEGNG